MAKAVARAKSKPADLVKDAMGKNGHGNRHVNVPDEYARAEWSVEDPPSLSGLKLLLLVIAACGDDLDDWKEFPMSMLREVPGFAHMTLADVVRELDQLMRARVRIPFLMLGNSPHAQFGVIVSDARLRMKEKDHPEVECFSFRFGETFKEMVRRGQLYAVLDSVAVLAMRSRHSVMLYQFLASLWRKRDKTLTLTIPEVRRVFGMREGERDEFKRFNSRVIVPACAEISALSAYLVTAEPVMKGRSAVAVSFGWKEKPQAELSGSGAGAVASAEPKPRGRPRKAAEPTELAVPVVSGDAVSNEAKLAFWADIVKSGRRPVFGLTEALAHELVVAGLVTVDDLARCGFELR